MTVAHRSGTIAERQAGASDSRPVMLVTFDVPVREDAAAVAVDSAVESGQPLLLVNTITSWPHDAVIGRIGRSTMFTSRSG